MKRIPVLLAILFPAILASAVDVASAQVVPRQYGYDPILDRPAVSPYMNLMRREGSTGTNYETLVVPQLKAQQAAMAQQRQIQQLQRDIGQVSASQQNPNAPMTTGHRTFFGNYSHFYSMGPNVPPAAARRR